MGDAKDALGLHVLGSCSWTSPARPASASCSTWELLWLARSSSDVSLLPANQEARRICQNGHAMHPSCEPLDGWGAAAVASTLMMKNIRSLRHIEAVMYKTPASLLEVVPVYFA